MTGCVRQVSYVLNKERKANVAPELHIAWDADAIGISPMDVHKALDEGEPRIQCFVSLAEQEYPFSPPVSLDG